MITNQEPHYTTGNIAAFALCDNLFEEKSLRQIIDAHDTAILKGAEIFVDKADSLDARKATSALH